MSMTFYTSFVFIVFFEANSGASGKVLRNKQAGPAASQNADATLDSVSRSSYEASCAASFGRDSAAEHGEPLIVQSRGWATTFEAGSHGRARKTDEWQDAHAFGSTATQSANSMEVGFADVSRSNGVTISVVLVWAKEVWKALGVEFAIFALTVAFAIVMKNHQGKFARKNSGAGVSSLARSSAVSSPSPVAISGAGDRASHTDPASLGSLPSLRQDRDGAMLVQFGRVADEIVAMTRNSQASGQGGINANRNAAKALERYQEFRRCLQGSQYSVSDVARYARHSTLDFYGSLVQSAVRCAQFRQVEELVDDMARQGVQRTLAFYEATMKQLAGQRHHRLALAMYDRLVAEGLSPSAVTCSCLVSFAAEAGEYERAIGFFEQLSRLAVPSIRAYMTVLRVYAKRQDWPASLALFRDMHQRSVPIDSLALNVILATGVAADKVEEVESLFEECASLQPGVVDVVSCNTLVKGHAQRGDLLAAARMMERMPKLGLHPNTITFNTVIDRAIRGFQSKQAFTLVDTMRDMGVMPDKCTCSILVKGLERERAPAPEYVERCIRLLEEVASRCERAFLLDLASRVADAAQGDRRLREEAERFLCSQRRLCTSNGSTESRRV